MKPVHLVLLTAFYALTACSQDTRQVFPDEFRPYVEAFFEDARARGHELLLEDYDLTVSFRDLDTEERWAYCLNLNRHKIRIDEGIWMRMKDQEKKWIMYHELGHCILDLPHRTFESPTGLCYSLMNENKVLGCHRDIYSEHWWKYYVDELFDPSLTPEEYQRERPLFDVALDDRLTLVYLQDSVVENRIQLDELISTVPTGNFSFTVKKTAGENGQPGFGIRVGGRLFQYCDCSANTISIYEGNKCFYETTTPFDHPVTLTIQREGELLYFYANGRYVHALEVQEVNDDQTFNVKIGRRLGDVGALPSFDLEIYAW